LQEEAQAQEFVMEDLAHPPAATGFTPITTSATDSGVWRTAPEFIYVLAFTPENLKSDGKFHKLQIALREPKGLTVQTRKGYYAPQHERGRRRPGQAGNRRCGLLPRGYQGYSARRAHAVLPLR
jgi:hypothetical protein